MTKKTMGLLLCMIELVVLIVLFKLFQYHGDYIFRCLILYVICQILFGHYQVKTSLIWDEIHLLLLSHTCFLLTSLLLLPTKHVTVHFIIRNLCITIIIFLFDVFISRILRLKLRKQCGERVMIIGTGIESYSLVSVIRGNRFSMMEVKCVLDPGLDNSTHEINEIEGLSHCIYPIESLAERIKKDRITELILAEPEMKQQQLDDIVELANHHVKKIKYVPRIKDLVTFDSKIEDFDGLIVISKSMKNISIFNSFTKRFIDICGGLAGCLLILPLTLYVRHINHKNGDYEPVYFKQNRIGKDGKIFVMYKFRTMIPNAENILKQLMETDPAIEEEYRTNKKLKNDPRITAAGKVLRQRSLDEFPQFINVLKGDMSVVGPRPYLPGEKDDMKDYYESIVASKPGVTGMWQSHGRNNVSFHDRCVMDDYYYRNWSLWLDITILIKTFKSVFARKGAM